ncbi:choice-of-anchor I family protein [Desulfonatronum thioautotrophicum]|uniref:choice-of-anchor I family protein n=1 Tax=Desulfonatronum thioautotrophicum TaxID=617001 RepID=UPI000AADBEA6|nr:choice-of-anchor I family protein [Desulfonatronum thioautotrophicum]
MRQTVLAAGLAAFLGLATLLAGAPCTARTPQAGTSVIQLTVLGQYQSDIFDKSSAEIVSYDPDSKRAFVINAASGEVDVLGLADPTLPKLLFTIDVSDLGADANSVAVKNGVVAVAVEAAVRTDNGYAAFYDTDGKRLSVVQVGALPDALTFSPDGRFVLVANEGEPNEEYTIDPEGSVSIIDLSAGPANVSQGDVRTADFRAFNGREDELREQGVRIFGPGASAAQDMEPEWVEVSADNKTAYVSLQENNAIAVVDIATATVSNIFPLGFKDWSAGGQWSGKGFDASDRDGKINIRHWPVRGIYQPDTIRIYETNGKTYLITANEGDARDYKGWTEEFRIKDLRLSPSAFPNAEELQKDENLGRLRVTSTLGVSNGCSPSDKSTNVKADCEFSALYAYGARSMSIFLVTENGLELVYDSGSQMEETTAAMFPADFNSNHRENQSFDSRSDDKGPEPEGIALSEVNGRMYAFVGLERVGGVMVYDITEPANTTFVHYTNNRDFSLPNTPEALTTTDLGAEGLHFIPAMESPDPEGRAILLVGNEVSGTTTIFAVHP